MTIKGGKLDFIKIRAFQVQRHYQRDFPGGPVVKNPPSNAGDMGSIPGQEAKIPHAMGQLRPPTTTPEPLCSRTCIPQLGKSIHHIKDPMQPK